MPTNDQFRYPGRDQSEIVSTRAVIPGVDTAIDLGVDCSTITVAVETGAADLYVNFQNAAATSGNYKIPNGTSYTYQGPRLRRFHILGTAAGPNFYGILAY